LTVSNCVVRDNQGAYGAGIYNDASQASATLTVLNSIITNNCACRDNAAGGGIAGGGELTIVNTTVSNNIAVTLPDVVGYGGGISSGGILTITDSTISGNIAASFGGGIISETVIITDSTISGNTAGGQFGFDSRPGSGGGIYAVGTLTISNSTITSNNAYEFKGSSSGGGIYTAATLMLRNSSVSDNWALNGGGLYNTGSLEIGTTILKRGFSGSNIFNSGGLITSHGYNLSDDDGGGYLNGPGDLINTDPLLGPLQNNGGSTLTHALLLGSPAIDSGDPSFTPPPIYDQRGPDFWRVRNNRIDIGSFEVQAGTTPTPTPTPPITPTPTSTPTPGQIMLTASGRRVQGRHTVDLSWTGANSANIDIFRDGVAITTVPNNGAYKDFIGVRGGNARYAYRVCEAGTQNCSNEVTVRFGGPPL
jgi:hypothetical protein